MKIKDFVSHNLIKCTSGVPQGSHLDPLFCLVFINEIISKFKSVRVWQYADDMKIALRIKDINDCFKIQCDLRELVSRKQIIFKCRQMLRICIEFHHQFHLITY